MPKQEGQKSKLLTLLRILEQKTDEEHLLNVPQLVELLEQQDILAERKSIYSDIDTLRSLGYDIQLRRGARRRATRRSSDRRPDLYRLGRFLFVGRRKERRRRLG